jgi:hypothetical protein
MSPEQLMWALNVYQESIKDFTLKYKEFKAAGGKIL